MIAFASREVCAALEREAGIKCLPLLPYARLDLPVCAHADMLINIIEENLFCYEDYYLENREIFDLAEYLPA